MVDWARIERVLTLIGANEDQLNQDVWASRNPDCGTSMCFAGWVVFENGDPFVWHSHENSAGEVVQECALTVMVDEVETRISIRARELLGITESQALDIYLCSATTAADLRRSIGEILAAAAWTF